MIRGVTGGAHIIVANGHESKPYISPGAQSAGMVRYNTNMDCLEVYDGISWLVLGTYSPLVELDFQTKEIVGWARAKMLEEQQLLELAKKHPGLQEAYERLEIMKTLTLKEEMKND